MYKLICLCCIFWCLQHFLILHTFVAVTFEYADVGCFAANGEKGRVLSNLTTIIVDASQQFTRCTSICVHAGEI